VKKVVTLQAVDTLDGVRPVEGLVDGEAQRLFHLALGVQLARITVDHENGVGLKPGAEQELLNLGPLRALDQLHDVENERLHGRRVVDTPLLDEAAPDGVERGVE